MDAKQKADYIRSPYHCPYCNSDNICPAGVEFESLTQEVECADCGEKWQEVYAVTDLEPKS